MKLRNKKTGETIEICKVNPEPFEACDFECNSLAELNEVWEDAPEEPKKHYEILGIGVVIEQKDSEDGIFRNQNQREIGNYFESKEEAEKAVEKLKAWKRLKDKGFRFIDVETTGQVINFDIPDVFFMSVDERKELYEDLRFVFGGEE